MDAWGWWGWGRAEGKNIKVQGETIWDAEYVHNLDCGNRHLTKLIKLYTLDICNYTSVKFFFFFLIATSEQTSLIPFSPISRFQLSFSPTFSGGLHEASAGTRFICFLTAL